MLVHVTQTLRDVPHNATLREAFRKHFLSVGSVVDVSDGAAELLIYHGIAEEWTGNRHELFPRCVTCGSWFHRENLLDSHTRYYHGRSR